MPSIAEVRPGHVMLLSKGMAALWRGIGASGSIAAVGTFTGPYPNAIAGLAGWWDAGSYAGMVDSSGVPLPGWGNLAAGITDKSGAGVTLSTYHYASSGGSPVATPRLAGTPGGMLGGVGLNTILPPATPAAGVLLPSMDLDTGLKLASASIGAESAWTIYLVWSRPNFSQGYGAPAQTVMLSCAGTPILSADAMAGPNARLILFPGVSQTVLTNTLERRHTHSVIIRNTPGGGVDVWLDAVHVATAVSNPQSSALVGPLLFLHSGTGAGSAQCWFHEAAIWGHALSSGDVGTLLSCATRWTRGARKGFQLVVMGQSNAGYSLTDGAWHLLAQGIAWHLGALAYNVIGSWGSGSSYTCISGHGISNMPFDGSVVWAGSFLADPEDGSDPSGWVLGADGIALQTYLASQLADDLADISLIVWPWSETDSIRSYSEKAFYANAVKNLLSQMRGMLSRSAPSLPMMWWNPIPFGAGTNGGIQMVREVVAATSKDALQNVLIGLPQTSDSNPRGGTWSALTGAFTGGTGDYNHRDATDNIRFGRLSAPVAARAILASHGGDVVTTIPAGIPTVGGPVISHVYQALANSKSLILTISHDTGTDLIVPLLAASGQGFSVMDGGSVASPGPIIAAVACVRVDATHLQITLATAPANPQSGLLLFYPFGYGNIFRGDAVTDNYASLPKPTGWDIGADLGSAWTLNYPLAATATPIPVSTTP